MLIWICFYFISTQRLQTFSYIYFSAREARDFIARKGSPRLGERQRCKSETYLLERRKSQSFSMLTDEVYMDDIECHQSLRRKLRAALGLEDASAADDSAHTSADNLSEYTYIWL